MTEHPQWLRDKIAKAMCDHRLPERYGPETCAICTEDADAVLDTLFKIGVESRLGYAEPMPDDGAFGRGDWPHVLIIPLEAPEAP